MNPLGLAIRKTCAVLLFLLTLTVSVAAEASLGSGPPQATMSSGGRVQRGDPGSSCWPQSAKATVCGDVGYNPPAAFLRVAAGADVALRILEKTRPSEVSVSVSRFGQQMVGQTNITLATTLAPHWTPRLKPGRYDVALFARWTVEGRAADASWSFGLRVVGGLPRTGAKEFPVAAALGAWLLVGGAVLRRAAAR